MYSAGLPALNFSQMNAIQQCFFAVCAGYADPGS